MWAETNDPDHLAAAAEGISASSKVGTFGVHADPAELGFRSVTEIVDDLAAEFCAYAMVRAPLEKMGIADYQNARRRLRGARASARMRKAWRTRRRRQEAA